MVLALPNAGGAAVGVDPNAKPGLAAAGVVFSKEPASDFCLNGVELLDPNPPKDGAAAAGSAGLLLPNVNGAVEPVDGLLAFVVLLLPKENPDDGVDKAAGSVKHK